MEGVLDNSVVIEYFFCEHAYENEYWNHGTSTSIDVHIIPKKKEERTNQGKEIKGMGFFSSGTTRDNNSLKDAMNEGLQKPYRFTSEADCISDTMQFLNAFCTPDSGIRRIMICNAASSVAGIRDSEIRSCLMGILQRCTELAPNECIRLTAAEKAILSKVV